MTWHRKRLTGTKLERRRGKSLVVAAPRGHAKSTFISLILPLHDLMYQTERYTVIISATLPQAKQRLRNIRHELLTNPHLRAVYGDLTALQREWNTRRIAVGESVIEVFSAGTEMRGISIGPWRPTKIILDDAEDSEAVENPERRHALETWFNEVIENLGNGYTHTQVIGTVLHPESLLMMLTRRPDYESLFHRSIESWATNEALWDQWRRILTDLDNPHRDKRAHVFFQEHREEMLEGTKVLWPEKEDYEALQIQLVTRGKAAFFQEKQNEPMSTETQMFDVGRLAKFQLEHGEINGERGERQRVADLTLAIYLDPALGREGSRGTRRGDHAAMIVAGRDEVGRISVLDVWMQRATPSQQAKQVVALAERWQCFRVGVEINGFQELLCDMINDERRERSLALTVEGVQHSGNKVARVSRLEPQVANGWIQFRADLTPEFFQQLGQFPRGAHDDGPDALEGVVAMLERGVQVRGQRTGKRQSLGRLKRF